MARVAGGGDASRMAQILEQQRRAEEARRQAAEAARRQALALAQAKKLAATAPQRKAPTPEDVHPDHFGAAQAAAPTSARSSATDYSALLAKQVKGTCLEGYSSMIPKDATKGQYDVLQKILGRGGVDKDLSIDDVVAAVCGNSLSAEQAQIMTAMLGGSRPFAKANTSGGPERMIDWGTAFQHIAEAKGLNASQAKFGEFLFTGDIAFRQDVAPDFALERNLRAKGLTPEQEQRAEGLCYHSENHPIAPWAADRALAKTFGPDKEMDQAQFGKIGSAIMNFLGI